MGKIQNNRFLRQSKTIVTTGLGEWCVFNNLKGSDRGLFEGIFPDNCCITRRRLWIIDYKGLEIKWISMNSF